MNDWRLSTISVDGFLSNIVHNEEKFYNQLNIIDSDKVICVSCNHFTIYHPRRELCVRAVQIRETKPSKIDPNRKTSGREFNSSIAIYVQPDITNIYSKHYEIKLFRTGAIDCLGVLTTDYSDFKVAADIMCEYLERNLKDFAARSPYPPMLYDINNYLLRAGEKSLYATQYIGPIRLKSIQTILQNWIYHVDIDRPRQSIKLQALVEYLKGATADYIRQKFNITPSNFSIEELKNKHFISINAVSTPVKDAQNIIDGQDAKIAKDITLKMDSTRPRSSTNNKTEITSKITRYAKIALSGLRDNIFVSDIKQFYIDLDLKRFVISSAIPDAENQNDEDEIFDIMSLRGGCAPPRPPCN